MIKDKIDNIISRKDIDELRKLQLSTLEILIIIDDICKKNNISYWLDGGTLLGSIRHGGFIPWDDDIDICMPREDYDLFLKIIKTDLPEDLVYEYKGSKTWYQTDISEKMSFLKIYYLDRFTSSFNGLTWNGIFVDIFPVDSVKQDTCKNSIVKLISKISNVKVKKINNKWDILRYVFGNLNLENIYINKFNKMNKDGLADFLSYGIDTIYMNQKHIQSKQTVYPLNKASFEGIEFSIPNDYDTYLKILYGDYMKIPNEVDQVTHVNNISIK